MARRLAAPFRAAGTAGARPPNVPEADAYSAHLESVAAQLDPQLPDDIGTLVLIPIVGFGQQSHGVLPATIRELAAQRTKSPVTIAMLVNRPEHRESDGTEELIRRQVTMHAQRPCLAVASVVVAGRPRVGSLRQLLYDAVAVTRRLSPSTAVVVADDDIVHAPPGALEALSSRLQTAADCRAVIGPVLFDDEQTPSALLTDFFISDLLRALLATRWVALLGTPGPSPRARSRSDEYWQRYAEAIVLSGNMAVRSDALLASGGFPSLNEITGLVQRVQRYAAGRDPAPVPMKTRTEIAGVWDFDASRSDVIDSLLDSAVRVSSRRALRAFVQSHVPSVMQWLVCRFHASRVDPARKSPPRLPHRGMIDRLGHHELARLVESTESLIATTLGFFPSDVDLARDALSALGLDPRRCTTDPPTRDGEPWRVRITDSSVMRERVLAAQRRLLAQ